MEKMNKAYVGTVERWSTAHLTETPGERTNITFKDGTLRNNPWPFAPHEECYLVKKAELDAFEARVEQLKHTQVWDENQKLKAKVKELEAEKAKLAEKNKALKDTVCRFFSVTSAEDELRTENERLKTENKKLQDENKELKVIKSFLEVGNEKFIRRNVELESSIRKFEVETAMLKGKLANAEHELSKFYGEHTVEFLYEKHEDGKHVISWTEVSGEEYELTFLTPERKIHE